MKKLTLIVLLFTCFSQFSNAQVTTYPPFPNEDEPVTIYYNASQGDKLLMNFDSTIYIHTGVETTGTTGWQYVVTTWGVANAAWAMTRVSANLYSFQITPSIRSYYKVPVTADSVNEIACVFRDASGAVKGAGPGAADIFYPVFPAGKLAAHFFAPATPSVILQTGQQTPCKFQSSLISNMTIYDNGSQIYSFNSTDSVTFSYTAGGPGVHMIKGVAINGAQTAADSFTVLVPPAINYAALPAGAKIGINYLPNDSSVLLVLCAPNKKFVYVIGEFNNWQMNPTYYMNHTPDSVYWWIVINGLTPGQEYAYQYDIDGVMNVGDEYCEKILDPNNDGGISAATYPDLRPYPKGATGIVSILQTAQVPYPWKVTNFVHAPTASMVIYELWVADFITAHNYSVLRDSVDYLKTLGVNAIELLPINEFEGNLSLGYNSNYYFAPDKYYGPEDSLKKFIDYCHQNGIAVIQDIALNDCFGSCPYAQMYWDTVLEAPALNNPWLNQVPTHPYNVGSQFDHESPYTKRLFTDITRHWLSEYHMDGFRFDLAKGYTQTNYGSNVGAWGEYDQSRINIWEGYSDSIKSYFPNAIMILEYFVNSDDNAEAADLVNDGLLLWNWGNSYCAYEQAAMGYASGTCGSWDLSDGSYQVFGGWNVPGQINQMESHDQERVMYKVEQYGNADGNYKIKDTVTGLARISLCANLFFTVPGPCMVWEFGELGFDYSVNWESNSQPTEGNNDIPKPIRWDYYQDYQRFRTFRVFASLIRLKETMAAFSTTNYTAYLSGAYKQLELMVNQGINVVPMGNFDVVTATYIATFPHTGTWYNYYDHSTFDVTTDRINITLNPGEFRLYTDSILPLPYLGAPLSVENVKATQSQLFEIYPNPADKNSSISFYISNNGQATVDIYDLTGKHISTVFNQSSANKGYYSTPLSTLGITSGTYILRLTTPDGVSTQKLVVQ